MDKEREQGPFTIIRNYRKMINRRDRHLKKRKPKLYPPTNIKTRSMEYRQQSNPSQLDFETYSQFFYPSSQSHDSIMQDIQFLDEGGMERENKEECQGMGCGLIEERDLDQKNLFCYWNDQVMTDLNDVSLLGMR